MRRRQLLATVGGLGAGTLAGCSQVAGPQTLASPTVQREDGEVTMHFGEAGDPVATSTFLYGSQPDRRELTAVKYRMSHRNETNVDSLELAIRAPPSGVGPPAAVYMAVPNNSEFPEVTLRSHPNSQARLIEIPDVGTIGRGTFGLDFFVDPFEAEGPLPVRIAMESTLSESGILERAYRLDGTVTVEIPME